MTSLSRLSDKGYLSCDRSTGSNLYTFMISENEYRTKESRNFLEKLYNNSIQNMVATLYHSQELDTDDIKELRDFLNELKEAEQ